jgi:hypothetical protein
VAFANAEAFRERFNAGVVSVKRTIRNQRKRARNGVRSSTPGSQIGRRLRTTTQARTKTRFLCRRRGTEESAVLKLWCAGGAYRAAINTGGGNTDEQQTVEARIAALQSTITSLSLGQFHTHILSVAAQ